jgi:DNA-directed RNA polymerase specialized sigma24 family protein
VDPFSTWADEHAPGLARFGLALTGDGSASSSLVSLALARVYAAWPAFHRGADAEMFARQVILHAHVTRSRRRRAPEAGAGLGSALLALPPRRRAVVVSLYGEGRTEADTATLLGWSLGGVKQQAANTLRDLVPEVKVEGAGADDVADALRAAYERIPVDSIDVDELVDDATTQGTMRRRRELQTRIGVFVAVCVFALAGLVGLSRGGRRIPRFGGPGALVTATAPRR